MLRSASVVERLEPVRSVALDGGERIRVGLPVCELLRIGLCLRDVLFGELALRGDVAHREPLRLPMLLHVADHEHCTCLAKDEGDRFRGEQLLDEAGGGFGALESLRCHQPSLELALQHDGRRLTREPHADDEEAETSRFLDVGISGQEPELRDADGLGDGDLRNGRGRSLELPTVLGIAARSGVRSIGPAGGLGPKHGAATIGGVGVEHRGSFPSGSICYCVRRSPGSEKSVESVALFRELSTKQCKKV